MPLPYEIKQELELPPRLFNADGLAVIVAHGARSSERWRINAFSKDEAPVQANRLGEILTTLPDPSPTKAFDTSYVWVNDAVQKAGNRLVRSEDLNHMYAGDQAPFFMLARFVIERV